METGVDCCRLPVHCINSVAPRSRYRSARKSKGRLVNNLSNQTFLTFPDRVILQAVRPAGSIDIVIDSHQYHLYQYFPSDMIVRSYPSTINHTRVPGYQVPGMIFCTHTCDRKTYQRILRVQQRYLYRQYSYQLLYSESAHVRSPIDFVRGKFKDSKIVFGRTR